MVLVTGSNGFIASHLLKYLHARDVKLVDRGLNRHSGYDFFQTEINEKTDYSMVLKDVKTIVHCAARVHIMNDSSADPLNDYRKINTEGTINLAKQAIENGAKRFIFISSIKVNGEMTLSGKPFMHSDDRKPIDFYGISKSEAEEQLLSLSKNTGLEVVIIRPTLVYGPGVKANFASLMNVVSKGFPLPFRCIKRNKRSLVFVDNVVDLIVTCIDHPKAVNQVFLVSDDHDVSTSEMVCEMAKALGKPTWQLPVPVWCYQLAGKLLKKSDVVDRLTGSLQVDIAHTKETLGWKPPQTLQEGFMRTAEAFRQSHC
ncbi:UDP-glucose 4-epimerase family protein [Vibrio fluvialis]|uniref:UDP-glucose 4-epimerase family protein n=1 Tax=Vibrio fluvialis TaxID=676 RepID=UPI001F2EC092|nr:SDR family oxidoreductase [Vibrio fluvialis]MCE7597214.1 SDR family oxidoreductase [Vibrio fluvialis]UPO64965.1 UDP-glcNac-4-epimerase [Vibrio fluvialis]